jgi:hypothetical protein
LAPWRPRVYEARVLLLWPIFPRRTSPWLIKLFRPMAPTWCTNFEHKFFTGTALAGWR